MAIKEIPKYASRLFFFLIILQIPLFRVPCRSGICTTPIHVTSSQLIASEIVPPTVVKALLYPGAVVDGLIKNKSLPSWDNIFNIYNLTDVKQASPVTDLQRLEAGKHKLNDGNLCAIYGDVWWYDPDDIEKALKLQPVLAGSYFSVAGAIIGILKAGRMSMFGTLLIIWGLVKEGILGKPVNTDPTKTIFVYPTMLIALVCAFSSVKYDLKKVTRSAPPRPIAKPLKSSSKSKLK